MTAETTPPPNDEGMLSHALTYAQHGVAIFPCQPRGKQPATSHGFKDATTDADQIRTWWTQHPYANIGIALGANEIFAVDVDGPDGKHALDNLEASYGPLPDTYQVITGRAEGHGRHLIYRQPTNPDLRVRNGRLAPSLETRGDGGYVIAPPSIHPSGRPYLAQGSWSQIADPPDWLVGVAHHERNRPEPTSVPPSADGSRRTTKRLHGLAGRVALAAEGERNNVLNWAAYQAGRMWGGQQIAEHDAVSTLLHAAVRAGLTETEAKRTIESGMLAGVQDPDTGDRPLNDNQVARYLADLTRHAAAPATPDAAAGDHVDPNDIEALTKAEIAKEAQRIRIMREARRLVDLEDRPRPEPPEILTLTERLARPPQPTQWRIEGWQPIHARVVLAAQYKAGKTTLTGNLTRSLVDGDPFLGHSQVHRPDGPVAILDYEMSPNQIDEWLRDQNITNTDQVIVIPMRGKASAFDLTDPDSLTHWINTLRGLGVAYLIWDCLRPVVDALGLDEHKDVGRLLVAFDRLLNEANVAEASVVHHMGHSGERSRGDSRIRDWPDVEWRLVRQTDDPSSPRFISAFGRDVDVHEAELRFDQATRHLQLVGGSRSDSKARRALGDILKILSPTVPITRTTAVRTAQGDGHARDVARKAVDLGIAEGAIRAVEDGPAQQLTLGEAWKDTR